MNEDYESQYTGQQIDAAIGAVAGKADKSEMSVTDGTGADSDKTTIQLKSGTSATVLKSHQSLAGKEDKMIVVTQSSGTTLTATVGNYYRFTYNVGTLDITLPTPTGSNAQSVLFFMTTGASPDVTFTSTGNTIYKNDGFAIDATTTYEINALYNGGAWVINAVKYTT